MFIVINKSYGPYVSAICDDMDSAQHELKREVAALRRIAGAHWTPAAGANVVILECDAAPAQLYRCRLEGDRNARQLATVAEIDGRPDIADIAATVLRFRAAIEGGRYVWWRHSHLDGNAAQLASWTLELRNPRGVILARIICEGYRYCAGLELAA